MYLRHPCKWVRKLRELAGLRRPSLDDYGHFPGMLRKTGQVQLMWN